MSAKKHARDILAGRGADLQLYRAVRRYIEERGGSIVAIGGIEIQEWPSDPKYKFRLAIHVMGNKGRSSKPSRRTGTSRS